MKNDRIMQAVADLFPGYFALVMATGIIPTATFLLEMKWLAWVLLVINLIAYAVLISSFDYPRYRLLPSHQGRPH